MADEKTVIRIGHFTNITHVQGLVAHNLSRQGKGWFETRLGPGVEIRWLTYSAGSSADGGDFRQVNRIGLRRPRSRAECVCKVPRRRNPHHCRRG
jgi:hypothetical protein